MKKTLFFCFLCLMVSCTHKQHRPETPSQIESAIAEGQFTQAEKMIKSYLCENDLPALEQQQWLFKIDWMNRVRKDFATPDTTVMTYLKKYYDSVSPEQIKAWEDSRALEFRMIDGKKCYFNRAARNLFRIDSLAGKRWEEVHGNAPDSLERFRIKNVAMVVAEAKKQKRTPVDPVTMQVTYTLSVHPDVVPEGEILRVWMPMPRTDVSRQTGIRLLSTGQPDYVIAPDQYAHKSIYMEQKAVAGQPAVFTYSFEYTSKAEWFGFDPQTLRSYDTTSELYKTYTAERAPHILFSDRIRKTTAEVVGNETNPYLKVKKIYEWIDRHFPWASAIEYSTIENIPEYVLNNHHGDCGQVSLLFITMARCAGVPAKWQSGWMMHPGNKNLHDWAEVYYEGIGWVPVDESFGRVQASDDPDVFWFYSKGIDAYRLIVNQDISGRFYPAKTYPRSETVDFQRGEVEWKGGNLYFDDWDYHMDIRYLQTK